MTNPGKVLPEMLGASLYAIACILSYDGMSGISLPLEPVDMLTSMVDTTVIGGQSDPGKRKVIGQNSRSFLRSLISPGRSQNATSNSQKVGIRTLVLGNCSNPPNHHQQGFTSVGNVNQRPSSQNPTISGSPIYGARISREDYPKRPRGIGP